MKISILISLFLIGSLSFSPTLHAASLNVPPSISYPLPSSQEVKIAKHTSVRKIKQQKGFKRFFGKVKAFFHPADKSKKTIFGPIALGLIALTILFLMLQWTVPIIFTLALCPVAAIIGLLEDKNRGAAMAASFILLGTLLFGLWFLILLSNIND